MSSPRMTDQEEEGCREWEGAGREGKDVEAVSKKVEKFETVNVESKGGGTGLDSGPLTLLPACPVASGKSPPSLIFSFLTCTTGTQGLEAVGALEEVEMRMSLAIHELAQRQACMGPLGPQDLVCTRLCFWG